MIPFLPVKPASCSWQVRAYHFGARYIVEMEVILPSAMTVRESHDIALRLQHKVLNKWFFQYAYNVA